MKTCSASRGSGKAGVAAIEFALVVPTVAAVFFAIVDFGMSYIGQLQTYAALSAGAEYAFIQGQSESGTTLTTDVVSFVNAVTKITLTSVAATYNNGLSSTSCYCVYGASANFTGPVTCGAACTDGSGSTAGKFVSITAKFTYTPIFNLDSAFFSPLQPTVIVRVQ